MSKEKRLLAQKNSLKTRADKGQLTEEQSQKVFVEGLTKEVAKLLT